MGRRKIQWVYNAAKAGGVDKILPHNVKGEGLYLTKSENVPMKPSPGTGRGNQVSLPISQRKEKLVRQWSK